MSGLADHTAAPAAGETAADRASRQGEAGATSAAPGEVVTEAAPPPSPQAETGLRERARMRRRARFLRRLRELQLRDLGGFLLEQLRRGRENPEVVQAKLADAAATDRELRALEGALSERRPLRELREPGVGGACPDCGIVHGSADRYCSWCGRKL